VRYEDLVEQPQPPLNRIGEFLGHDLDYARIQQNGIGSVKKPLTSFKEELKEGRFSPVGRWKNKFPEDQLVWFERLAGNYLVELGYPLSHPGRAADHPLAVRMVRFEYKNFYGFKQWAKVNTPLSRWMVSYSAILTDK